MDPAKIKISVQLHTILQIETPEGPEKIITVELPAGSSMNDLLSALNIQLTGDQILLVLNGRTAESGAILQDGDRVNLMPAISGG